MYTYLSSHVHIIRYTNNTYVLLQMLQVSLQHCCWASYQIAEQVTIVNLVALRGSWGVVLDNDLESNRRPGPGEGTNSMKVTTYAPPFWPAFFRSVWSLYGFDPNIWTKIRKMSDFDHFFVKMWQNVLSRHPFWPFVAIWVNGRCWESLSETQPRTPPSVRLCRGSPVNMWLTGHLPGTV